MITLPAKVAPLASFACQKQDPIDWELLSLCLTPLSLVIITSQNHTRHTQIPISNNPNNPLTPTSSSVVTEKKIINKAGDLMIEPTHQQTASGAGR
jgi:hypothetical protein